MKLVLRQLLSRELGDDVRTEIVTALAPVGAKNLKGPARPVF